MHPAVTPWSAYFLSVLGASDVVCMVIMHILLVSMVLVRIFPALHIFQEIVGFLKCGHNRAFPL